MPLGMLLVGNKTDLGEQDEREVSTETGETFSKVCSVSYRSFEGRGGEGRGGGSWSVLGKISHTVEPLYCGHLGNLVKCPV